MDAFYASVEQRDQPSLAGKPVIVGATGNRGVVCAASYEARRYGVHSAMPISRARRLCPDGVYIRPRMAHYQSVSHQVFDVFREFTPEVEGLSLDEAFLDVSASRRLLGSMVTIGRAVKQRVSEVTGLVASVGLARNKFLAKLASDYDKPDGFFVIEDEDVHRVLDPLPIRRLWGIGEKSGDRLAAAGVTTIGALRSADEDLLRRLLGNRREHFLNLANGRDQRPVVPFRREKSISHETTFSEDLTRSGDAHRVLMQLSQAVGRRLRRKELGGTVVQVKLRRADFRTYTRQRAIGEAVQDDRLLYQVSRSLFDQWWDEQQRCAVRLLGVGVAGLEPFGAAVDLFAAQSGTAGVNVLMDDIRSRFGSDAVTRARAMDESE